MSLLDRIGPFPRDLVAVHLLLKMHRPLYKWLLNEAWKRGISTERYIALVLEEKRKEQEK
jgi:hypothetical protein